MVDPRDGEKKVVRVLIADDDLSIHSAMRRVLRYLAGNHGAKIEITHVETVEAAIDAIVNNTEIQIVFSDTMMDDGTGVDLHQKVHSFIAGREGTYIAMSGKCPQDYLDYYEVNSVPFFDKPFDMDALSSAFIEALERAGY